MNLPNTTARQDRVIAAAEASTHITDLIDIILDLDAQISEWKDAAKAAGCDTPDELRSAIE